MQYQQTENNYDLRAVVLPKVDEAKGIQASLCQLVVESWAQGTYLIPGSPLHKKRKFVDVKGEIQQMEHKVSRIDAQGRLQPLPITLEKFLAHPATAAEVE